MVENGGLEIDVRYPMSEVRCVMFFSGWETLFFWIAYHTSNISRRDAFGRTSYFILKICNLKSMIFSRGVLWTIGNQSKKSHPKTEWPNGFPEKYLASVSEVRCQISNLRSNIGHLISNCDHSMDYTNPCASIASATFTKPPMLAPAT